MSRGSCSAQSVLAGVPRIAVSVNGVAIPHDAISREAQNHPAPTPLDAWKAAARALIVRELLLAEARRLQIRREPAEDAAGRRETDEEALVRGLIDSQVTTPEPDAASCRRYYDSNRARFRSADIFQCAHILVAVRRPEAAPDASSPAQSDAVPAQRDAARRRAEALRTQLDAEPHTFAALASAHSDCPSRANGGNLGQVTRGMIVPELERTLLQLGEGEISPVVESRYGFHIVRLDRRIAGAVLPFEAVHERIAAYLAERSRRLALAQYIARLVAQAEVTGVDMPTPGDLRVH